MCLLAALLSTSTAAAAVQSEATVVTQHVNYSDSQMETNAPKRRDNKKSLRVKVISLGNAEVGKVSEKHPSFAVSSMPVRNIVLAN